MAEFALKLTGSAPPTYRILTATGVLASIANLGTAQWMGMKTYHWVEQATHQIRDYPRADIYRVVWSEDRLAIEYGKEIRNR